MGMPIVIPILRFSEVIMRQRYPAALVALAVLIPSTFLAQEKVLPTVTPRLKVKDYTIGKHLEVAANLSTEGVTVREDVTITIKSNDPKKLLISSRPEAMGSESITVTSRGGWQSPEVYLQALSDRGSATYTASAPGFTEAQGKVIFGPSGFAIALKLRVGVPGFQTTTGGNPQEIGVFAGLLDENHKYAATQAVAGGMTAKLTVTSSDTAVGTFPDPAVTIPGGYSYAMTSFHPKSVGKSTLAVSVSPDFTATAESAEMVATVKLPGINLTDNIRLGQNLQVGGTLSLGEIAPGGGLTVTLTSTSPNLLLAKQSSDVGSRTIRLDIPGGRLNAKYYIQGLGKSGTVSYTANAPGYAERTATVELTPSGVVVVGPLTLPEGQLLNKEGPRQQGFLSSLAAGKFTSIEVLMVQLDPISLRGADITVQALRGGMSVTIPLHSSDPAVGSVGSEVTIEGGYNNASTHFTPLAPGTTTLSLTTPDGFTKASNDTTLRVVVRP